MNWSPEMNDAELATVMQEWFSDLREEGDGGAIDQAKRAGGETLMAEVVAVRDRLGMLFSETEWYLPGRESVLEGQVRDWFVEDSEEREGLEDFAQAAPDDVPNLLDWLRGILAQFERGEAIPTLNGDFEVGGSVAGTEYYKLSSGQWLYGPSRQGADWAPLEDRLRYAVTPAGNGGKVEPYFDTGHFTKYENDAYTFGESADATFWHGSYQELLDAIAATSEPQPTGTAKVAVGDDVEPYFDTGHFTKYANDTYYFGETRDTGTWHGTYQELLDAISLRAGAPVTEPTADHLKEEETFREFIDAVFGDVEASGIRVPDYVVKGIIEEEIARTQATMS